MFEPNSFVEPRRSEQPTIEPSDLVKALLAQIFGNKPLTQTLGGRIPGFVRIFGPQAPVEPMYLSGNGGHMSFGPPISSDDEQYPSFAPPSGHMTFGPQTGQAGGQIGGPGMNGTSNGVPGSSQSPNTPTFALPKMNTSKSDEYLQKARETAEKVGGVAKPGITRNPTWQEIGLALAPSLFGAGTNYIGALGQGYLNGQQLELQRQNEERMLQMKLLQEQAEQYFRQAGHYQNQEANEYLGKQREAEINQSRSDAEAERDRQEKAIHKQREDAEAFAFDQIAFNSNPERKASMQKDLQDKVNLYNDTFFKNHKGPYTLEEIAYASQMRDAIAASFGSKYGSLLKALPSVAAPDEKPRFAYHDFKQAQSKIKEIQGKINGLRTTQAGVSLGKISREEGWKIETQIQDLAKQRDELNFKTVNFQNEQDLLKYSMEMRKQRISNRSWTWDDEEKFQKYYEQRTGKPWRVSISRKKG